MAATAQSILDWLIANWPNKLTFISGSGAPSGAPPVASTIYINDSADIWYYWTGTAWRVMGANDADVLGSLGTVLQVGSNLTKTTNPSNVTIDVNTTNVVTKSYLETGGKIKTSLLPALAITDVFVYADIQARDTAGDDVQKGDICVVTDASADVDITAGSATYIYDGTGWVYLKVPTDAVTSVNGFTGAVQINRPDEDVLIPVPVNAKRLYLKLSANATFYIQSIVHKTEAGTVDVSVDINDVQAVSISSTSSKATSDHSGSPIEVAAGESLSIVCSNVSSDCEFLAIAFKTSYVA